MAEAPLSLNMEYFLDPTNGKPVSNGKVYIGEPDLDPLVLGNRVNVVVVQEDGTRVTIAPAQQPLTTGVGRILYLGDPVVVLVDRDYSIRVDSSLDAQIYYAPRANEWAVGTFTVPVDNVAALKLIEGSFDGQQASVAGYYDTGDGGDDLKYWDAASTETPNDGTIIQVTGVTIGRWKSVDVREINFYMFGAKFDEVTDDTLSIQNAINAKSLLGAGPVYLPNKKALISTTIIVPIGVSLIGEGRNSGFIPDPTGSFTSGFMLFLNTTDGSTWDTTFPGIYSGEVRNLMLDNSANRGTTIRGIKVAGSHKITQIKTDGLSQVISTINLYTDMIRISDIHGRETQGAEYQIDIGVTGDGLFVENFHFTETGGASAINSISVNSCTGGIISGGIGGNHKYINCRAMLVTGCHSEQYSMTIENSSIEISNSYFWVSDQPSIIFTSSTTSDHVVALKNIVFAYRLGNEPASYDKYDIQIHSKFKITLENCVKQTTRDGALSESQSCGILVKDSAGSALSSFNNYSHLLSVRGVIDFKQKPLIDYSIDLGTGTYSTMSGIQDTSNMTWTLATNTYYYKMVMIYDVSRYIGQTNTGGEQSISKTLSGGATLIPFDLSSRSYTGILRLYRGTTTNSYDNYVDVPLVSCEYLYDDGSNVNGFPWITRVAGVIEVPTIDSTAIKLTGPKLEFWNDTTPTSTDSTFIVGDIMWTETPAAAGNIGSVVTTAGSPGTWKTFGVIAT